MIENIFPDIFFIFLFGIKIGAAILCNLSICKNQFQILILQLIEINFCYMQFSVLFPSVSGGKDFSTGILTSATQFSKFVCFSGSSSLCVAVHADLSVFHLFQNMHTRSEIQCIDQLLLNLLIQIIVQRIDFYRLTKDFFKLISDRRYRIGDDRETSLLAFDIAVRNLTNLIFAYALLTSAAFP